MDEYTKINHKRYSSYINEDNSNNKLIKYLRNLISRILLSVILIISMAILIRIDSNNIPKIKEYIFTDSLKFTQINKWYQDNFGKILPEVNNNEELVFSSNDFYNNSYEKYQDGVKINIAKGSPISSLMGGIVVLIGNEEGYGNTIIIQGNDGIDYWYGNIDNISVNLYDYIEKDTLIGDAHDDYIYFVLEKDNNYLDYEEYLKEI